MARLNLVLRWGLVFWVTRLGSWQLRDTQGYMDAASFVVIVPQDYWNLTQFG